MAEERMTGLRVEFPESAVSVSQNRVFIGMAQTCCQAGGDSRDATEFQRGEEHQHGSQSSALPVWSLHHFRDTAGGLRSHGRDSPERVTSASCGLSFRLVASRRELSVVFCSTPAKATQRRRSSRGLGFQRAGAQTVQQRQQQARAPVLSCKHQTEQASSEGPLYSPSPPPVTQFLSLPTQHHSWRPRIHMPRHVGHLKQSTHCGVCVCGVGGVSVVCVCVPVYAHMCVLHGTHVEVRHGSKCHYPQRPSFLTFLRSKETDVCQKPLGSVLPLPSGCAGKPLKLRC